MQLLTNRSKKVSNKKMTLMEKAYLPAIISGMGITLGHFFKSLLLSNGRRNNVLLLPFTEDYMYLSATQKDVRIAQHADFVL